MPFTSEIDHERREIRTHVRGSVKRVEEGP